MQENRRYTDRTPLDLRSILRDLARSWWMILLLSLAAALLTYSAISIVHKPEYTVSTTFVVTTEGTSVNDVSNISTAYSIAQKFSVILENNILKKKVAEELNMGEASPDEDEFLNLLSIPLDELCDMIARGDIADGKTQAAVLKVKYIIDKRSKCQ